MRALGSTSVLLVVDNALRHEHHGARSRFASWAPQCPQPSTGSMQQYKDMLSDEIAIALGPFFDRIGPSHDEIRGLVKRAGLEALDQERDPGGNPIGKMKRVRGVLRAAVVSHPDQGAQLVRALIDAIRAHNGFRPTSGNFPGVEAVHALREALRNEGMDLDEDGNVRPLHLESLDGRELTDALWSYVRRARRGGWDAALVLGTAKSLEEAAARHVVKQRTGQYPMHANMPATLYAAFSILDMAVPTTTAVEALSPDPREAIQQAAWLLAIAVNKFRNAEGEGHGRPEMAATTQAEADVVGLAAALVTQLLLDSNEQL